MPGTVEHIGIRSTQIRTLDRTVVSIPNGQLSSISVENFALRDRFLFKHTLNLRYETTADQLRFVLARFASFCTSTPGWIPRRRACASSAWVNRPSMWRSSPTSSRPCRSRSSPSRRTCCCGSWTSSSRAAAALPSPRRPSTCRKDEGLDAEKGRAAAETVRRWRDEGELALPGSHARNGLAPRRHAGLPAEGLGPAGEERPVKKCLSAVEVSRVPE